MKKRLPMPPRELPNGGVITVDDPLAEEVRRPLTGPRKDPRQIDLEEAIREQKAKEQCDDQTAP